VRHVIWLSMICVAGATLLGCNPGRSHTMSSSGPGGGMQQPSVPNQVVIDRRRFSPATITVAPGTTVTWVNHEDATHTVTADDKSFDSGKLDTGKTFSHTFDTAGTYPYHCEIHYGMTGQVVVK
jgi:plastocyanin